MTAISLKPKQSIHLLLNQTYNMNNPRLSIRLEESVQNDDNFTGNGVSIEQDEDGCDDDDITVIDNRDIMTVKTNDCKNCDSMKKMLYLRDQTIMKLIDDRDQLKIKLTRTMNENIELQRKLLRYSSAMNNNNNKNLINNQPPASNDESTIEKQELELQHYRRRCQELIEQNQQMKYHLYSLRNVFVELGQQQQQRNDSDENDSNDYQDICNESSSSSMISYQELPNSAANNNNNIVNDNNKQTVAEQMNKTKSTTIQQPIADNQNNNRIIYDQHSIAEFSDEPILSNFDRWYNS